MIFQLFFLARRQGPVSLLRFQQVVFLSLENPGLNSFWQRHHRLGFEGKIVLGLVLLNIDPRQCSAATLALDKPDYPLLRGKEAPSVQIPAC